MTQHSPVKPITEQQAMRYSRQILLPQFDLDKQEMLLSSKALIIGLGGLGCASAQYLVSSGVNAVTLIDDDIVDTSNLSRQVLHTESSVGQYKVDSAADSLRKINSECIIEVYHSRLSSKALAELINKHDIVLDCTDNLDARNQINQCCVDTGTPLVSGAAIRMEGQIFCMHPDKNNACYGCFSHSFGEQHLTCVEAGVMGPIVGIIGAAQALEAIKVLCHYGTPATGELHLFDGLRFEWQTFKVEKRLGCPVCDQE